VESEAEDKAGGDISMMIKNLDTGQLTPVSDAMEKLSHSSRNPHLNRKPDPRPSTPPGSPPPQPPQSPGPGPRPRPEAKRQQSSAKKWAPEKKKMLKITNLDTGEEVEMSKLEITDGDLVVRNLDTGENMSIRTIQQPSPLPSPKPNKSELVVRNLDTGEKMSIGTIEKPSPNPKRNRNSREKIIKNRLTNKHKPPPPPPATNRLPYRAVHLIGDFLTARSIARGAMCACRHWNNLLKEDRIWIKKVLADFTDYREAIFEVGVGRKQTSRLAITYRLVHSARRRLEERGLEGRVLVAGATKSGKSSIIHWLCNGNRPLQSYIPTVGAKWYGKMCKYRQCDVSLAACEISGSVYLRELAKSLVKTLDVLILVADPEENPEASQECMEWFLEYLSETIARQQKISHTYRYTPVIVLINDRRRKIETDSSILPMIEQHVRLRLKKGCVSAMNVSCGDSGENVDRALGCILQGVYRSKLLEEVRILERANRIEADTAYLRLIESRLWKEGFDTDY